MKIFWIIIWIIFVGAFLGLIRYEKWQARERPDEEITVMIQCPKSNLQLCEDLIKDEMKFQKWEKEHGTQSN